MLNIMYSFMKAAGFTHLNLEGTTECHLGWAFLFKAAFEDGEEENTLSIVGQGHLMISNDPIELSEFCPSSYYTWTHQILVVCNRVHVCHWSVVYAKYVLVHSSILQRMTYWFHHKATFSKQSNINKCVISCHVYIVNGV